MISFVPNLIEIGLLVLEKIFFQYKHIVPTLVTISPAVLEKKSKQTDRQTMGDQKSSLKLSAQVS
jgi:hypothetical protein